MQKLTHEPRGEKWEAFTTAKRQELIHVVQELDEIIDTMYTKFIEEEAEKLRNEEQTSTLAR